MSRRPPLADPSVRRVAIVRLRVGLGDLLASVPALRALKQARPDVDVTMITWSEMDPVIRRTGYVDDLLPFPGFPGIPERPPRLELRDAFFEEARRLRFDLALQMYGERAAANEVTERLGARIVGGFRRPGRDGSDPATHIDYPHHLHEVDRHRALFEHLGIRADDDELEFRIRAHDEAERDAILARHGLEPFGYVCVHPGATAASRRWPPERFAAVADSLAALGWRILLIGARGEEHIVGAVQYAMRAAATNLCGRTTLGGLAALLSTARVLIGNDSGPAQLAVALRVPSVIVFLAGDPKRWAGRHPRHRAIQAGVDCQPCGHLTCPIDFRCAHRVIVGQVVAEAVATAR